MKYRITFVLSFSLWQGAFLFAQEVVNNLLIEKSQPVRKSIEHSLKKYKTIEYNKLIAENLVRQYSENLSIEVPMPDAQTAVLDLINNDILFNEATITTSSGMLYPLENQTGRHYQGVIRDTRKSMAAISLFDDEIFGIISNASGNIIIGKDNEQATHLIYNPEQFGPNNSFECYVEQDKDVSESLSLIYNNLSNNEPDESRTEEVSAPCVRIYYECKYDMYQELGSIENVTNFITAIHNQVATLFSNEGIQTPLSEIKIWDTEDPYTGMDTNTLLKQFKNNITTFNGDLAQLLTFKPIGGGRAHLGTLCRDNPKVKTSVVGITRDFNTVPTYSWTVYAITHELGHLMGSYHTHTCVWNGNRTAIDGCFGSEELCKNGPIPTEGGTIMSYCHLHASGINFSLGFGLQPSTVINKNIKACSHLQSCHSTVMYTTSNTGVTIKQKMDIKTHSDPGVFFISTEKSITGTVQVVNISGQTVFFESLYNQTEFRIDISNYPKGIYLINIEGKGFAYSRKISKTL